MFKFKDFTIRQLEAEQFFKLQDPLREKVFSEDHSLFPFSYLSQKEKDQVKKLRKNMENNSYNLYLGVFNKAGEFVAWHFGFQKDAQSYYMCNSAVLPFYRRKGLYTVLLKHVMDLVKEQRFSSVIFSS